MSKNRDIPKKAHIIIDKLMSEPLVPSTTEVSIPKFDITLKVPHEKFVEFNNYAKSCGMSIVDWIIYVLEFAGENKELLLERLQEDDKGTASKIDEDSAKYGKPTK